MKPMRKNSLEAQLADAEALLAKRDAALKAWDEGPEGARLRELEAVTAKIEAEAEAASEALSKLRREVGLTLGVMAKSSYEPSVDLLAKLRAHVGLAPREPLDAMPGMNSFRGSRETGERILRIAARDLMDMLIDRDPEVAKLDAETDRLRKAAREARDAEREFDQKRARVKNGNEFWRIEETIRQIKDRMNARDVKPISSAKTPEEKKEVEENVDRLRAIRDELVALADWARGSAGLPEGKAFTWEKP